MPFVGALLSSPKILAGIGLLLVLALLGIQTARLDHAKSDLKRARAELASLQAQEAAAAARTAKVTATQAKVTTAAGEALAASQTRIRTVTQTILKEVPVAVLPSVDPMLPGGWLRLYNASALGVPPAAAAAGGADDAHAGLRASDALAGIVVNNGACLANADKGAKLQAWLTGVLAAQDQP
jgi:hypothetical protein